MIRIWELHRDLANAIGDGIDIDAAYITAVGSIPDGSRFTKTLRDSYLYRAALKVFSDVLDGLMGVPKDVQVGVIENIFPNMIREVAGSVTSTAPDYDPVTFSMNYAQNTNINFRPAMLLRSYAEVIAYGGMVPVPIRKGLEIHKYANARNIHRKDLFVAINYAQTDTFTWTGTAKSAANLTGVLYNPANNEASADVDNKAFNAATDTLKLIYLPYPVDPSEYNVNDFYLFEDGLYDSMLSYAALYAMVDSQDYDIPERVLPILKGGTPQGPRG
tara:strand:+ start:1744 stop:2565 length:822 start_codon:yes stop_codon:yes gene_type:complete